MTETEMLSGEQLKEIEARAGAATPGPLEARLGSGNNVCTALASVAPDYFDEFVCDVLPDYACRPGIAKRWEANRNFIQRAYTDIPALCQTVRALRLDLNSRTESYQELEEEYSKQITDNTALREQLAQVQSENERLASQLKEWQEDKDMKAGYL